MHSRFDTMNDLYKIIRAVWLLSAPGHLQLSDDERTAVTAVCRRASEKICRFDAAGPGETFDHIDGGRIDASLKRADIGCDRAWRDAPALPATSFGPAEAFAN
jgi:hypothetical protein